MPEIKTSKKDIQEDVYTPTYHNCCIELLLLFACLFVYLLFIVSFVHVTKLTWKVSSRDFIILKNKMLVIGHDQLLYLSQMEHEENS